jgi:hypothetical protein
LNNTEKKEKCKRFGKNSPKMQPMGSTKQNEKTSESDIKIF